MSVTTWVLVISLILTFGIIIVAFMMKIILFKHRVRVVDLAKQGIELDFKARDYVKDGVRYWQLDKERVKEFRNMPLPPARAINIAKKGKKSVEVIRTETGEYVFLDRSIYVPEREEHKRLMDEIKDIPKEIEVVEDGSTKKKLIKEYQDTVLAKWRKKTDGILIETYEPLTSKQRMILMNNFNKANARKTFSLRENIPMMVSIGSLVILIVSLFIFWGDIAQPAITAKSLTKDIVEIQKETVSILQDIKQDQQTIKDVLQIEEAAPN